MAYLHCHSCDWAQDDFWKLSYNPVTKVWDDVKWLIRPRVMEIDDWFVNDLVEYTGVRLYRFKQHRKGQVRVFSWQWLWLEFWKELKLMSEQSWWTWESWVKARATAVCPKCGKRDFDID